MNREHANVLVFLVFLGGYSERTLNLGRRASETGGNGIGNLIPTTLAVCDRRRRLEALIQKAGRHACGKLGCWTPCGKLGCWTPFASLHHGGGAGNSTQEAQELCKQMGGKAGEKARGMGLSQAMNFTHQKREVDINSYPP